MTSPAPEPTSSAPDASHDGPASPAEMAGRVALLTNPESAMRAGELPMWNRLQPPARSSWLSRILWFLAWCGTLVLLSVALLRVAYHDGTTLLIWCNAFTQYFYLPAYPVLVAALWKRRWWLAAVSGSVIGFHLVWFAADFTPAKTYPNATTQAAPRLRVFYANLRRRNLDYQSALEEIATTDPDVIVFAEYDNARNATMQAARELKPYIYGTDFYEPVVGDVVVFSRLPVREQRLRFLAGQVVNFVDIPQGNETLRIIALHSPRPLMEDPDLYAQYWNELEPLIARETGPTLVIGDFNATQHSAVLDQLTAGRLRSAHVDRGRGYASTWPNGHYPLPPIRIDHALISPEVECLSIVEGEGRGSDHKPLLLDLQVHGPVPGAGR